MSESHTKKVQTVCDLRIKLFQTMQNHTDKFEMKLTEHGVMPPSRILVICDGREINENCCRKTNLASFATDVVPDKVAHMPSLIRTCHISVTVTKAL